MKKAYSLLELSIVTIIIGVLISGVLSGVGMIRSSKTTNARLFTTKAVVPEISGLVAWYEAAIKDSFNGSEANDATALTAWYDINPGSNSNIYGATRKNQLVSSSTGVTFVSNGINGTPSVKFSGATNANFILKLSGTASNFYQGSSLQNTVFLVFRPLTAPSSTAQVILDSISTASTTTIDVKDSTLNLSAGTTKTLTPTTGFTIGTDYIVCAYFNGTSSQGFVNEATTAIATTSGAISSGTPNQITGLTIGTNKSGSAGFGGLISEIIVYNRPLKIQERKDVMDYLSKKYKISVTGL